MSQTVEGVWQFFWCFEKLPSVISWGIAKLFSRRPASFYISTSSVWRLQFFYVLASACYLTYFFFLKKMIYLVWCWDVVGKKASTCKAGIPCGCRLVSWLFHFCSSYLPACLGKPERIAQSLAIYGGPWWSFWLPGSTWLQPWPSIQLGSWGEGGQLGLNPVRLWDVCATSRPGPLDVLLLLSFKFFNRHMNMICK